MAGQTLADGRLRLETLDVSTEALTLSGNLALGPDKWPEEIALTGRVANASGDPLLLPLPGTETRIDALNLDVNFDAANSDAWSAEILLDGLERPDLQLAEARIDGAGTLSRGDGQGLGTVAGAFDIAAQGLAATDAGLAEALGEAINGRIVFDWQQDAPLDLAPITLTGAGIDLDGSLRIEGLRGEFSPRIAGTANVAADDLGRFSGLAGRDLGGAVDVSVTGSTRPLDGAFDVTVEGTSRNLETGVPEADRILQGEAKLAIDAMRDETGILLRNLDVEATGGTIAAEGSLRTGESTARFDVALADTALVLPALSGPARLQGTLEQTGTTWTLDTTASGPGGADIAARINANYDEGVVSNVNGSAEVAARDIAPYGAIAQRDIGGAVDLAGSGIFDPVTQQFSGKLSGTTTDLQTSIDQVDGLLNGETTLQIDAERNADGIVLRDLRIDATGIKAQAAGQQTETGSTAKFDITLPDASRIEPRLQGPARIQGTFRQADTTYTVDATGTGPGGVALDAQVTADYADGTLGQIEGSGSVSAADLAPYGVFAQRDIGGAVDLSGTGRYDPQTAFFAADVAGSVTDLQTGIEQLDGLLAGRTTLALDAERDADGILLRNLDVQGSGIVATAEGVLRDADSGARFDIRLPDASLAVAGPDRRSPGARLARSERRRLGARRHRQRAGRPRHRRECGRAIRRQHPRRDQWQRLGLGRHARALRRAAGSSDRRQPRRVGFRCLRSARQHLCRRRDRHRAGSAQRNRAGRQADLGTDRTGRERRTGRRWRDHGAQPRRQHRPDQRQRERRVRGGWQQPHIRPAAE